MLMVDNEIKEGEESDNVSIHSIVSDQVSIDSDNETPTDQVGQSDKIILNHVVKYILYPGYGVDKPSKFDYVTMKYKCYFKPDNIDFIISPMDVVINPKDKEMIIEETEIKGYIFRVLLPYGIVKAISFMRKKEIARIVVEPKYGFRKVEYEKFGRYIETTKISDKLGIDTVTLYEKMKTSTLIYEIELIDFVKIYDLTGNRNLMKRIITYAPPNKLNRPMQDNEIKLHIKLLNKDTTIAEYESKDDFLILNDKNFTDAELTLIKSMKKGEQSSSDIAFSFFKECYTANPNSIITKQISETQLKEIEASEGRRLIYQVTLINLKNCYWSYYYKEKEYTKKTFIKGIGNISPWKDSLIMLMSHITINGNVVYSNIPKEYTLETFRMKIKELKKKIQAIPFYEQQTQFIVDSEIKKIDNFEFPIYDPMERNFPVIYRKEILQSMKPLCFVSLTFTIEKDNYEENYFCPDASFDLSNYISFTNDNANTSYNIVYTCCLINFEEYLFVLNNKLITNKAEKLNRYKDIANGYFSKGFLHKAKKIYKKLSDSYIKFINLGMPNQGISFNAEGMKESEIDITKANNYDKDVDEVMRKVMSNLVIVLYRMKRKQLCEKYINEFLRLYVKDEKVMYYKFKVNEDKGFFEEAETALNELIAYLETSNNSGNNSNSSNNIDMYKNELTKIKKRIESDHKKQNNYMKKMMKNI